MRLATFTDHGLRVLLCVALAPGGRTTIAEVARRLELGENHVVKVAHMLGRLGFLANARGHGGGLRLAAPAASINLARVVAATESWDLVECFDPAREHLLAGGTLRDRGRAARGAECVPGRPRPLHPRGPGGPIRAPRPGFISFPYIQ